MADIYCFYRSNKDDVHDISFVTIEDSVVGLPPGNDTGICFVEDLTVRALNVLNGEVNREVRKELEGRTVSKIIDPVATVIVEKTAAGVRAILDFMSEDSRAREVGTLHQTFQREVMQHFPELQPNLESVAGSWE